MTTDTHHQPDPQIDSDTCILQMAVPSPLNRTFDYLPPTHVDPRCLQPGMRLRLPFGRSSRIGIIMAITAHSRVDKDKLKPALELLDDAPVLPLDLLALLEWASRYYHHAPGNVISNALPALLRQGQPPRPQAHTVWRLTDSGRDMDPATLTRAPRQRELLQRLAAHSNGLDAAALQTLGSWRPALRSLMDKGWVTPEERYAEPPGPVSGSAAAASATPPELNPAQQHAVTAVTAALGRFQPFLLEGITGSGKTEVYFRIIEQVLARGQQALLLVPEIGLTPQLVDRFRRRFTATQVLLHSALSDRERLDAWLQARDGQACIIIGTRSAVFVPCARLGIIIIDEEHDASFKQQDGFRYHARDIAIVRAQRGNMPILLGSATPSLESLYNAEQQRYQLLALPERIGDAVTPGIRLLDVRHLPFNDSLSPQLLDIMRAHLKQDNQVLLFLNRRGYAPTLLCHDCGWLARCERCDAHLIYHHQRRLLRCHHCDAQRPLDPSCPECGSTSLLPVGHGTERIEDALHELFPDTDIVRIDRDSTRRKGSLHRLLDRVRAGHRQILLGTQMLAKGHHLPNVTLVAIISADQGLFSIDFRASERLGQMVIQVAGRAGRADKPGEVLIQTHHPEHPLLQNLLQHDYHQFARQLLAERQLTHLPPYNNMVLLRAEAVQRDMPQHFLQAAQTLAMDCGIKGVDILGPLPAAMERRAGRYRALLVIQAKERRPLHQLLARWLPQLDTLANARKVRWSIDVDPIDMM
jgi:primosomal protein N' (replication factor Y)